MIKEKIFPISWGGWDRQDTLVFTFYDVLFHKKFGEIPINSHFDSITVDYGLGILECYGEDGETIEFSVNFVCKPVTNE